MVYISNLSISNSSSVALSRIFLNSRMFYQIMGWFRQFLLRVVTAIWEIAVVSTFSFYYYAETIILSLTPPFLRTQKSLRDKVVVITGGAGGVGQELALRLARIHARVVVWDVNEKAIEELNKKFQKDGYKLHSYLVDVADRHNVYKNAELVKNEVGPVDIIINNAGIIAGHTLLDLPDELIEKTFQVNVFSNYWTIKAFLGDMLKRGKGHIVSVGSLTAMLGTYKCTDYSASKCALTGLHESLSIELKAHGHDNICMTLIAPYFINTGMFEGCKPRYMDMLEPKAVAKRLIKAIRREEVFVSMPEISRFTFPMKYYMPAKLLSLMVHRVIQGPKSMKGLKGVQEPKIVNCQDVAAA